MSQARFDSPPTCLIVPGHDSRRRHGTAYGWASVRDDAALVDIDPDVPALRNVWLSKIDQALTTMKGPSILVGEGVGALAIAWWGALLGRTAARKVAGAMLMLPADPEAKGSMKDSEGFGPLPTAMLPFPSIVVAALDSRSVSVARWRHMAADWMSDFVVIDHKREVQAPRWRTGEQLLELLQGGGPGLSRYSYRPEPVTSLRKRAAERDRASVRPA